MNKEVCFNSSKNQNIFGNLSVVCDKNTFEVTNLQKILNDIKGDSTVKEGNLARRFQQLEERCRNIEDRQTTQLSSLISTKDDTSKVSHHQIILLEQTIQSANDKIRSLTDQLTNIQNEVHAKQNSSSISVYELANKIEQLENFNGDFDRKIDNLKGKIEANVNRQSINQAEYDKNADSSFKNYEYALSNAINILQDRMTQAEQLSRQEMMSRVLSIEQGIINRIEAFTTAAQKIKIDITQQFSKLQGKLEDKVSKLENSFSKEKLAIATALQQNECVSKEMEKVLRLSNKEIENIIFKEISKRERNSKMIYELEKSVQDICHELDTKMTVFESKCNEMVKRAKSELSDNLMKEHKIVISQLTSHDNDIASLGSLLDSKCEKLSDYCNSTCHQFEQLMSTFTSDLEQNLKDKIKSLESNQNKLNSDQNKLQQGMASNQEKIEKFQINMPQNIEKLTLDINRLKNMNRDNLNNYSTLGGRVKKFETSIKLANAKNSKDVNSKTFKLQDRLRSIEQKVGQIENVMQIDGKRIKSIWTAVVAESSGKSGNDTQTGIDTNDEEQFVQNFTEIAKRINLSERIKQLNDSSNFNYEEPKDRRLNFMDETGYSLDRTLSGEAMDSSRFTQDDVKSECSNEKINFRDQVNSYTVDSAAKLDNIHFNNQSNIEPSQTDQTMDLSLIPIETDYSNLKISLDKHSTMASIKSTSYLINSNFDSYLTKFSIYNVWFWIKLKNRWKNYKTSKINSKENLKTRVVATKIDTEKKTKLEKRKRTRTMSSSRKNVKS